MEHAMKIHGVLVPLDGLPLAERAIRRQSDWLVDVDRGRTRRFIGWTRVRRLRRSASGLVVELR